MARTYTGKYKVKYQKLSDLKPYLEAGKDYTLNKVWREMDAQTKHEVIKGLRRAVDTRVRKMQKAGAKSSALGQYETAFDVDEQGRIHRPRKYTDAEGLEEFKKSIYFMNATTGGAVKQARAELAEVNKMLGRTATQADMPDENAGEAEIQWWNEHRPLTFDENDLLWRAWHEATGGEHVSGSPQSVQELASSMVEENLTFDELVQKAQDLIRPSTGISKKR